MHSSIVLTTDSRVSPYRDTEYKIKKTHTFCHAKNVEMKEKSADYYDYSSVGQILSTLECKCNEQVPLAGVAGRRRVFPPLRV